MQSPDTAQLRSDCQLLLDEVDRLEYELTLAHGKLSALKQKKRTASKRS
jgi:hypothetical protein